MLVISISTLSITIGSRVYSTIYAITLSLSLYLSRIISIYTMMESYFKGKCWGILLLYLVYNPLMFDIPHPLGV